MKGSQYAIDYQYLWTCWNLNVRQFAILFKLWDVTELRLGKAMFLILSLTYWYYLFTAVNQAF